MYNVILSIMKILIIKLGADGDVLRTIPLARAIKDKFPNSEITWVTGGDVAELLSNLGFVSHVSKINDDLKSFDRVYNFDIEKDATDLAIKVKSAKRYGFYRDNQNQLCAFNLGAEYYLNTIFDDELKKNNKKTYQEMMFELAELPLDKERYVIALSNKDKQYANEFSRENNLSNKNIIGIHMGASSRWPSKAWAKSQVTRFIELASNKGFKVILFGGPNEVETQEKLYKELKKKDIELCRNNPLNTKAEFAALISICNVVICSDSLALHVSLGLGKKTIALFFCTSPWEVEGYGLLTKIVAPRLFDFFPERSNEYDLKLTESISAEEVFSRI